MFRSARLFATRSSDSTSALRWPSAGCSVSFAATTLIPRQFDRELSRLRTIPEIQLFARRLGIAPGIVVGRLQNDGILEWRTQANKLKRRFTWSEEEAG